MPSSLLVFQNDLRLHDNTALVTAVEKDQPLVCLFCIDPDWFKPNRYGLTAMGSQRWNFLRDSLSALDHALTGKGQRLNSIVGKIRDVIPNIVRLHNVDFIVSSQHSGYDENSQWGTVRDACAGAEFHTAHTFTLFNPQQLSALETFPTTFSQFRKQMEKIPVDAPVEIPAEFPPPLRVEPAGESIPDYRNIGEKIFHGGENHARQHLADYFSGDFARHYKTTRNALDDWHSSCKFSPWLANGCLSVRQVVQSLREYEHRRGANEATGWIYFELLWREYFQWYARHHGKKLFRFRGIHDKKPLTSFYPKRFKQWCQGRTPWPIVNACMAQLNHTGYMSNRGRQLVASCLIYDLGLDWRWGAAWFEQQLLDYDLASNWGNWQYIAGVGADPRGGRHFNLEKQTQQYDPDGVFIERWDGATQSLSMDTCDAADWPLEN